MNILIVCTGNTCRSPMAGGLLRKIAGEQGLSVEVRTAGLASHPNGRVAEKAVAVLQESGMDISDEYSKPVTPEALAWADLVVTVQRSHAAYLLEEYPEATQKVCFLEPDVPDPYNGSLADYRKARDQLEVLLSRFVLSLQSDWTA
jgi:protein-tyrosine-phosphatase